MKVLLLNGTKVDEDKIYEYFPGIELVSEGQDITIDSDEYWDIMDLIRTIRLYCPKYLQEFAEDLEEVMNEERS